MSFIIIKHTKLKENFTSSETESAKGEEATKDEKDEVSVEDGEIRNNNSKKTVTERYSQLSRSKLKYFLFLTQNLINHHHVFVVSNILLGFHNVLHMMTNYLVRLTQNPV